MIRGIRDVELLRIGRVKKQHAGDQVAEETPIAMLYNDRPFAVMLASPTDLDDFALGFAMAEGVIDDPADFRLVDCRIGRNAIELHAHIPQRCYDALERRRQAITGRSGCGLCGWELLQEVDRPAPVVDSDLQLPLSMLRRGLAGLSGHQSMNQRTGGMHAAALVTATSIVVREDIGRHNAVDKLVGALAGGVRDDGFMLVTSRASYEIVHKAAHAGFAVVVAISAPTSLAIELAERCGITLVAFAREGSIGVYTHPSRIVDDAPL